MKQKAFMFFCLILLLNGSLLFASSLNEKEIKDYLDAKEVIYEDISRQMGVANWNVYSMEGEADQDTPKERYFKLFNDSELISNINEWFTAKDELTDNLLKRRIEVWKGILTGAQVDMNEEIFKLENKLEAQFANNDTTPEDRADNVLELMKMRNKKAMELGYDNYAAMMFELSDFGYDQFNSFVEEMIKRTEEPYNSLIEEKGGTLTNNDIRQFIGMYYRNSGPAGIEQSKQMDLLKETLANIGLNFDELPIRFVEKEIPYGGNALAVSVPEDMRIVMNLRMPLSVWMHEAGHGLQGTLTKINQPILEGYEWCLGAHCPAFSEGMAEVGAGFIRNKQWQLKYTSSTDEEINERFAQLKKYFPGYLRMWFTTALFEAEFYKDLSQDPKELRDKIYQRLLKVDASDLPFTLGDDVMYVSYPVYYQNYIFAAIVATQVHTKLEEKFGKDYIFNKEVGKFLIDNLYATGELEPWREKLKMATGKEFDVDGYFKHFGM